MCSLILETSYKIFNRSVQKMLRVKEEEMSSRERRDGSYHRRRHYSDDYDSEVELYHQYKAAGLDAKLLHTV